MSDRLTEDAIEQFADVLLIERLRVAVTRINPGILHDAQEQAIRAV